MISTQIQQVEIVDVLDGCGIGFKGSMPAGVNPKSTSPKMVVKIETRAYHRLMFAKQLRNDKRATRS